MKNKNYRNLLSTLLKKSKRLVIMKIKNTMEMERNQIPGYLISSAMAIAPFQPIRCPQNGRFIMNPVSTWGGTIVTTEGGILDFSTPKSPENAFSGIFTYLKSV